MTKRKKIIIASSFLIILFLTWWGIYLPKSGPGAQETIFKIEKGEGSRDIALNLQGHGLIKWGPFFRIYVLLAGVSADLQAGTYLLSPSMNIPQIAWKMALGNVAKAKITIPEGFSAKQIHDKLKNVTMSDVVTLENYEGYLFPDTYEIPYGMAQDKIIKIMTDNFAQKTAGLQINTDIIIMASLIEKEVRIREDKELVSGILWKRLRASVPLQVDVEMWTYKKLGLPPRPIANPGLESIQTALYPKNSAYWYYLSTPEGKTIFSKTLDEHNYAKAKYLK